MKIPTPAHLHFWHDEVVKYPSFVNELSEYQKIKLFEYCQDRIDRAMRMALNFFERTTNKNYPDGWPEERQLEYVVRNNAWSNFAPTVRVLNALGYNWSLENYFEVLNKKENTKPKPTK